ncbi:MAG: DUF302 domain-containing protein [Bacteroidota bacterium]
MNYGISRSVGLGYDQAVTKVTDELKREGFGVLTTIDVKETMRQKLGVDFRRYVILGACNPPLAYRALSADEAIGLLLPCNVVVYETGGGTTVAAFDPRVISTLVDTPELRVVAEEARAKLERVIAAV